MSELCIYNEAGEKGGAIETRADVFGVSPVIALIHQVYTVLSQNAREPWAHTKNKGEVRGGGKKPWKQKGTGRARHGSIRSPIWKGGGITFGPRNTRNYTGRLTAEMRRRAVAMCLSDKIKRERLIVVETLPSDGKTKTIFGLRARLPGADKSTLVIQSGHEDRLRLAVRNLDHLDIIRAEDLNVIDLLHHEYIVTTPKTLEMLADRLATHSKATATI